MIIHGFDPRLLWLRHCVPGESYRMINMEDRFFRILIVIVALSEKPYRFSKPIRFGYDLI